MKKKKNIVGIILCIILIGIVAVCIYIHSTKITNKELIEIFNMDDDYELLNRVDNLGGNNYRYEDGKNHTIIYKWDNITVDNRKYDYIQITDDFDSIPMVLVELSFYDLKDLNSYIKDFSKEYGDYWHGRDDTYEWRKDGAVVEIWIHRMDGNPYKASITIER